MENRFLSVFKTGHFDRQARPPLWMMRQAGRYLPEYREIRAKARDFLHFCYTPEMAIEATLQPISRFGFDAAIIFSDILVIPDALGQPVRFEVGEGPRLDPIKDRDGLSRLSSTLDFGKLEPVYDALRGVRARLANDRALIGFCGAPFTLATYMIAGQGTADQAPARNFAYRDPDGFAGLLALLVRSASSHLIRQIEAGADAVQIFDSWAGVLPRAEFEKWSLAPIAEIVLTVKQRFPEIPVIAFPRGISGGYAEFVAKTGCDALGVDTSGFLSDVRTVIPETCVTQGNLDPLVLVEGGRALDDAIDRILGDSRGTRHIFNLGHGILPHTPIAHVERLVQRVRG